MKDGIYFDISIEDYHNNKTHVSSTNFRKARKSLKEFKYYQDNPDTETKSCLDFGNAFELALLEPKEFDKHVAIKQDAKWYAEAQEKRPELTNVRASSEYKAEANKFITESSDKYIINDLGSESYETIEHMLASCKQDAVIQKLLKDIEYQTSIFWTDKVTGLRLKTRPDVSKKKRNVVVDIKTAEDGSPEAFSRSLAKYDYPFQACMQIDGCNQSGYMKVDTFFWLVVEKKPPYNATIYEFSQEDRAYCFEEYDYVKHVLKQAYEQNKFPGYSQRSDNKYGVLTATIPLWYRSL